MRLLAKTFQGLEPTLAAELAKLGASRISEHNRAVAFEGDQEVLYKANLQCRTAIRILVPIHKFRARNENQLYRAVQEVDWSKYLTVNKTIAVDAAVSSDYFNHSKYVALKTKDAIVDQCREHFNGKRPDVDVVRPTYRINIHIRGDEGTISLDSSGDSLHKRGYRDSVGIAMCGSGTILIEACRFAIGIPAFHEDRRFGFEFWNDFNGGLWNSVKKRAYGRRKQHALPLIMGCDKDRAMIKTTHNNIWRAGHKGQIKILEKDMKDFHPPEGGGVVITNPPYEVRIITGDINELYKMIGDRLKQVYQGWEAWIISANRVALKNIGLKTSRKLILFNGPLECRFQKYELYAGSRKFRGPKDGSEKAKT